MQKIRCKCITIDGTYQYCQQVQTDHDIRKKMIKIAKHANLEDAHLGYTMESQLCAMHLWHIS